MGKERSISAFASEQLAKLFGWIALCLSIGYIAAWLIGSGVEILAGGDFVNPLWIIWF